MHQFTSYEPDYTAFYYDLYGFYHCKSEASKSRGQ